MMLNPRIGQIVQVWYGKRWKAACPYHGKTGVVAIRSRGKPRNHGVVINGSMVVVPCGNLRKVVNP